MRMFGLAKNFERRILQALDNRRRYFTQYVGDDVLLTYCRDDFFLYLDARDASLTPVILREGTWEADIAAVLERVLLPGECFVDIGANNGIHSLRAARRVGPEGVVVAFEPQARLAQLVRRGASANLWIDRMHVRRMAIGAHEGVVQLGTFDHLTGSATLTFNSLVTGHEEVPIAPLPQALAAIAQEIGRSVDPDVIKIDAEGFEYNIWDGMRDWAKAKERLTIVLEYSPVSYQDMGRDARQLLREFQDCGFDIDRLQPGGVITPMQADDLDAMAVQRAQFDLLLHKGRDIALMPS